MWEVTDLKTDYDVKPAVKW